MKKVISIFAMIIMLFITNFTAFAGDVPEGLLSNDDAQVFFGEVLAYNDATVTVCPHVKIKGDVLTGTQQHYDKPYPVGNFKVKPGNVYLFTYFDENNETNIFEVTSYDTATLKIKNTDFDIWKRFESYLNDGEYEKAEQDRINKINATLTEVGDEITLAALTETNADSSYKVEIGLFGKQERYEIDKREFFRIADRIRLIDVENTLVMNPTDGLVIHCYEDGDIHEITIWDNCKVAGSRVASSSAPTGDYIMKAEDYKKLSTLLPEDAKPKLPPLKSLYANFIYWFIYNSTTAYIIGAIVLVVIIGAIGFIIGYKIKKKKARR